MKLLRKDFTHAQDKQLATIGIRRAKNAGWLKDALKREFTEEEVKLFHSARRKLKVKEEQPKVATSTAINFGRPHLTGSGVGTMAICDRFIAGENIRDISADYGLHRKHIEEAIRFELARLVGDEDAKSEARTIAGMDAAMKNFKEGKVSPPIDLLKSPEDFANQLFESSGRDLG